MRKIFLAKTLIFLGVAAVAANNSTGTALGVTPSAAPSISLNEVSDSPAGPPYWGFNADGWIVRIYNDNKEIDYGYDRFTFQYKPTFLNNIEAAQAEIPAQEMGYVKGVKKLFSPSPANADVLYKSEWQTIHVFLRADDDGTTHHHCETSGPSGSCTLTQQDLGQPVEVHTKF